ncbi:MAG: T9SS type A sorting domain-containing protein [Ignavibacteria bacterium]|nr:T9SS type A sorting domain-containing protein [Ignavibacteria bacterium]
MSVGKITFESGRFKRNNTATVTGNDITLNQNFPNPFNPSTSISFTLSSESPVKLSVYDIAGREVDLIINQNLQAGLHSYIWNAGNFSSGVYYFRLVSGDFSETKQMNLVK